MDDKFLCGIAFGMLGGTLLATHSVKTRQAIKDGEQQVKDKVKELTDSPKKKKS